MAVLCLKDGETLSLEASPQEGSYLWIIAREDVGADRFDLGTDSAKLLVDAIEALVMLVETSVLFVASFVHSFELSEPHAREAVKIRFGHTRWSTALALFSRPSVVETHRSLAGNGGCSLKGRINCSEHHEDANSAPEACRQVALRIEFHRA